MKLERLEDWLRWQQTLHPAHMELGLKRVGSVWARMGRRPAPCVITVGGTNGKGSCAAYLDAILRAAGYRVGRYTSPHLARYNERIVIQGRPVSDLTLIESFQRVEGARGDTRLTYFEYGTLAALDLFQRADLDVAVLEVGLGGRLDAVNLIDADVALVTNVDLDHAEWLGADRESIGREKAGILRRGRPAVYGESDPPDSVLAAAEALGTPLWVAGRDYDFQLVEGGWTWRAGEAVRRALPLPAMRGAHQLGNAAAALTVLHLLGDRLPVEQKALRSGLLAAAVPGRFQVLPGSPRVVLDVAHNPQAARVLADNLRRLAPAGRILAVFGALADKDVAGMVEPLAGLVDRWHLAPLEGPRALSVSQLRQRMSLSGDLGFSVLESASMREAYERALAEAKAGDTVIAFGSFLVVSVLLEHLGLTGA